MRVIKFPTVAFQVHACITTFQHAGIQDSTCAHGDSFSALRLPPASAPHRLQCAPSSTSVHVAAASSARTIECVVPATLPTGITSTRASYIVASLRSKIHWSVPLGGSSACYSFVMCGLEFASIVQHATASVSCPRFQIPTIATP